MALHRHNFGGVRRDVEIEAKIISYINDTSKGSSGYWAEQIPGSPNMTRLKRYGEYRLRYQAHRSVASLYRDAKTKPFPNSSNIGVGMEAIFGEWLVAQSLGNSIDLEPSVEVIDIGTGKVDDALTLAHDTYLRNELCVRKAYEISDRETYTVGSCINKWDWRSVWKQREVPLFVLVNPMTGQPLIQMNPLNNAMEAIPVDPKMPEELIPKDSKGVQLKVARISSVEMENVIQGPRMKPIPIEHIDVPPNATSQDPDDWDYIYHNFEVTPWWFLGREGEDMGQISKVKMKQIWTAIGANPNDVWKNPNGGLTKPIKVKECHLKFPVTISGKPVEIIALFLPKHNILAAWRISPFPRRPFFNRQVWSKTLSPFGKGIPESVIGLRNALDAMLNQDIDSGNLYNHPPLLISSLAMVDDEDYSSVGPGTVWTMTDINGAAFLTPPLSKRDPLVMLNWIMSMTQRYWGVTDLNLNAPSQSLSPNIRTARGTVEVINQGNVKFGHLTKKLEETRTQELKMMHEMFRTMLTLPRLVSIEGKPKTVDRSFYKSLKEVRVRAVGDGVFSNPSVRQKMLVELGQFHNNTQNEFVRGDPEIWHDYTMQLNRAFGLRLDIKEPAILQQLQLLQQVASHPIGQQKLQEAMQLIEQQKKAQTPQGGAGNGATPQGAPQAAPQGVPVQ